MTKAEYLSLKEEYDQKAQELERELAEFQKEEQDYKKRFSSWEELLASLKGYYGFLEGEKGNSDEPQKEKNITRKMALELIQSIRVSGYNELQIVWNFQDAFVRMKEMVTHAEKCGKEAY